MMAGESCKCTGQADIYIMMLRPNPPRCGKWRAGVPTPGRCAYWTPRSLNKAMTAKTFSSCYPVHYPKIAIKLTSH